MTDIEKQKLLESMRSTGCSYRWNYPIIKYDLAQIRTCCQVGTNELVHAQQLEQIGKDVFLNSDYLVERKKEMLSGIKHQDCSPCWSLESAGITSMRQRGIPLETYLDFDSFSRSNTTTTVVDATNFLARVSKANVIEIQLDNICDLSCVYCNANYSTSWAKKTQNGVQKSKVEHLNQFQETFWQWYESVAHTVDGVCLVGGEPLLSPYFFDVLNRLNSIHGNKKKDNLPFISITSNFNAKSILFSKFLQALDFLKNNFNIRVNASCEATEERAEFIRDGLSWEQFELNVSSFLEYLKKNDMQKTGGKIDFSFHLALNALSLECLPDFLRYAKKLEIEKNVPVNLLQNIVSYPKFLAIQSVLPSYFSKYCDEALQVISSHSFDYDYHADSSWESYGKFIQSISSSLVQRQPEKTIQDLTRSWLMDQNESRTSMFNIHFKNLKNALWPINE